MDVTEIIEIFSDAEAEDSYGQRRKREKSPPESSSDRKLKAQILELLPLNRPAPVHKLRIGRNDSTVLSEKSIKDSRQSLKRPLGSSSDDLQQLPAKKNKSSNSVFTHRFKLKAVSGFTNLSIEDEFSVVYTSSRRSLNKWIKNLPAACTLGFDTEGNAVVTQLCCLQSRSILIFCMQKEAAKAYQQACADLLSLVLGSKNYVKVGIGAFDDAIKLHLGHQIRIANIFDLEFLRSDLAITQAGDILRAHLKDKAKGIIVIEEDQLMPLPRNLKGLFQDFFSSDFGSVEPIDGDTYRDPAEGENCYLPGESYVNRSWSSYPLAAYRLTYAAKDAIFGSLLYNKMITRFTDIEVGELNGKATGELKRRLLKRITKLGGGKPKKRRAGNQPIDLQKHVVLSSTTKRKEKGKNKKASSQGLAKTSVKAAKKLKKGPGRLLPHHHRVD